VSSGECAGGVNHSTFFVFAWCCCWLQIRVWFTADVADDMPWKFTPTQEYVTVHPGESVLAFFTAHNRRSVRRHRLCWFSTFMQPKG
jgi:hypothetical protein